MLSPFQQGLKRASKALLAAVGGPDAAGDFCRLGRSQLYDACNINCTDRWLPVDVVADLEAVTRGLPGAPHITGYLARHLGLAVFELPRPEPMAGGDDANWPAMLAGLAKEGGEVMAAIATHAMDGLTPAEIRSSNLIGEIDEALQILVNMRAAAVAVVAG